MNIIYIFFNFENNVVHTPPYLSITIEDILNNNKSLADIIYNKFKMANTACPICFYEGVGNQLNLKKNEKYKNCLLQNYLQ